jgi:hypothetical protein
MCALRVIFRVDCECNCHYLVGRAKRNKWKMMTSSLYTEKPRKKMRHVSVCSCQDIWPSISLCCWAHYRLSKQQQTHLVMRTQNFGQQRAHTVDDLSTVFPSQSTDHSRNRRRVIRFPPNQHPALVRLGYILLGNHQ